MQARKLTGLPKRPERTEEAPVISPCTTVFTMYLGKEWCTFASVKITAHDSLLIITFQLPEYHRQWLGSGSSPCPCHLNLVHWLYEFPRRKAWHCRLHRQLLICVRALPGKWEISYTKTVAWAGMIWACSRLGRFYTLHPDEHSEPDSLDEQASIGCCRR